MNSRRHFLKCCSGALLGSAVVPAFGASLPSADLSFAAFTGHLKSAFTLIPDAGKALGVILSKVEIQQPTHRPDQVSDENFNVHFTSPSADALEQGTYTFRHPSMGDVQLFVVPHKIASTGHTEYIATFHGCPVTA